MNNIMRCCSYVPQNVRKKVFFLNMARRSIKKLYYVLSFSNDIYEREQFRYKSKHIKIGKKNIRPLRTFKKTVHISLHTAK